MNPPESDGAAPLGPCRDDDEAVLERAHAIALRLEDEALMTRFTR